MRDLKALSTSTDFAIRPLDESDVPAFLGLIQALADYEKLPGPDEAARRRLAKDAVTVPPRFSVLLAEHGKRLVGYAVYFETYSTFLARPTLYVEDIFVLEDERRLGVGTAFMVELAREAARRGCGRMEWQVLKWNTPAIEFYQNFRAAPLEEWQPFRITENQFAQLAVTKDVLHFTGEG